MMQHRESHQKYRIGMVSNIKSLPNLHLDNCSVRMVNPLLVNESSLQNKSITKSSMKNKRQWLDRYKVLLGSWRTRGSQNNRQKVKSMQRSGTEAIRTQLQISKPKLEITNITNSQKTKITYGQPSEQIFPKVWPLNNRNRSKTNMDTRKVKRHRNT